MKNCLVGQSGGPTAAINSSLAGVIKGALDSDKINKIYGMVNGITGILNDNLLDITEKFTDDTNLKLLIQTPASYLGSCRYKLDTTDKILMEKIFNNFKKYDIGYFFYIGGNDSMDTVLKLSEYAKKINSDVKIIGIPKTIDNDLAITDHTPGFGSAAKYIATTVKEIALDALVYDVKSVTIVEIMGRNAGWLTAASALSKTDDFKLPQLIYLPEVYFDEEEFLNSVKYYAERDNNVLVCVSEGIRFKDGTFVCESLSSGLTDTFGHKYLSGTAKVLENMVREKLGYKSRGVELNVCQRAASHIASKTDLYESFNAGKFAVNSAVLGNTGKMVVINRHNQEEYEVYFSLFDISEIANKEKCVPKDFINENGNGVTQKMIDYLTPLIQGENQIIYKDGLPLYIKKEN